MPSIRMIPFLTPTALHSRVAAAAHTATALLRENYGKGVAQGATLYNPCGVGRWFRVTNQGAPKRRPWARGVQSRWDKEARACNPMGIPWGYRGVGREVFDR